MKLNLPVALLPSNRPGQDPVSILEIIFMHFVEGIFLAKAQSPRRQIIKFILASLRLGARSLRFVRVRVLAPNF
jgi:hypothetical protein